MRDPNPKKRKITGLLPVLVPIQVQGLGLGLEVLTLDLQLPNPCSFLTGEGRGGGGFLVHFLEFCAGVVRQAPLNPEPRTLKPRPNPSPRASSFAISNLALGIFGSFWNLGRFRVTGCCVYG